MQAVSHKQRASVCSGCQTTSTQRDVINKIYFKGNKIVLSMMVQSTNRCEHGSRRNETKVFMNNKNQDLMEDKRQIHQFH